MTLSWFDPGSISKILNISLLWFNEQFRFENLVHKENMKSFFWKMLADTQWLMIHLKKIFMGKGKKKVLIVFSISHKKDVKIFQKMDY